MNTASKVEYCQTVDVEYEGACGDDVWQAYREMVGKYYATPADCDENYMGHYSTAKEWAETYARDTGLIESEFQYFDADSFLNDCKCGGDITVVDDPNGGVYIFSNH